MTESLFRRLLLRFALVPALSLCLFLAVLGLRLHQISVSRMQVADATATLLESNHLLQTMIDKENGIWGFLLSNDPAFLEPYHEASARFSRELRALSSQVAQDSSLAARVARIAAGFRDFDQVNAALLAAATAHEPVDALLRQQKQAMDRLRAEVAALDAIESGYRNSGRQSVNALFRTLPVLGIGGGLLVGLLLIWHGIYLFREITVAFRRQLAQSEAQRDSWHTTLQSIGDAVIVCDQSSRITLLNPTAEQLTGWTTTQALGQPLDKVFQIIDEGSRAAIENPIATMERPASATQSASHPLLIRRDGAEIPIDDSGAPIRDTRGNLIGMILVFRSIAERKQAQDALQRSEERLRLALTAAEGVGIWDWDVRRDRVYLDPQFATLYGLDAQAAQTGTSADAFTRNIHPDDYERVRQTLDHAVANGKEFSAEYRLLQADKSVRWVAAVGRCSLGPDGLPARFPGVSVDITARKQTEEALRESEARLQAIYATSLEYIGLLNPAGQVLDANRALLAFADTRRDDVVGTAFWDSPWFAYTRGAPELVRAAVAEVASGKVVRRELPLRRPSGAVITFDFSLAPVLDDQGRVLFMVPEGRDISDLKRVDEALRASEERLRISTETARLGTWELDLRTGHMEASGICREHFGRSPNDRFTYRDLLAAVHPEDRKRREAVVQQAIEADAVYRLEYRAEWPDNSQHWILASGRALRDDEGMNVRMIGVTLDVTDRRQAEAALLQSEKLAAVGRLAATIAHEINNPLESVTNLLYLARRGNNLPEVYGHLDVAESELRRVSVITTQTLRFHKQSTHPRAVSATELLESVLLVYQSRLVGGPVVLQQRLRSRCRVVCFDGEIRQVLNNLVGNALDALPAQGGTLFLRSREGTEWQSGRKGLVLTIADTGSGIPAKSLQRIFDPFYTTKGASGTGLGLWVSKEIVDRHQGRLRVRSHPQPSPTWTVFTLFLPFDLKAE
jgi:PAS domain S-box-containing protein